MITKEEFEKSIATGYPEFWSTKSPGEVADLLTKDIANMVGFEQCNPHHCYNLWEHTLHAVAGIPEIRPIEVRVATFLHDSGKPLAAKWKEGRLTFYGHPKRSGEVAKVFLQKLGYSAEEQQRILFYITHHDDFIPFYLPSDDLSYRNSSLKMINEKNIAEHLRSVMQNEPVFRSNIALDIWENLLSLCNADVRAQAEEVFYGNRWVDSRKHKIQKISYIRWLVEDFFAILNF